MVSRNIARLLPRVGELRDPIRTGPAGYRAGRWVACVLALLGAADRAGAQGATPAPADPVTIQFFETSVRPLLAERCYSCHGPDKQKGGLRLDSRAEVMKGGDSGPVVVPGHPERSLLVKAISYQNDDLQMPPKKKLGDRQVADLTRWVQAGAPWPQEANPPANAVTNPAATNPAATNAAVHEPAGHEPAPSAMGTTPAERAWWAFQPVRRGPAPVVNHRGHVINPIDAFVLAKLEAKGLEPNPPAGKRALIRRAYYDLIGLPPAPEEVEAFAADPSPNAYESLIDRLLAKPEYGERWGRHWLDLVRYAQTNGYERDGEKPQSWRYRDYVIKAFNQDKPYDRFVVEQLAGDEVDDVSDDSITATGYYRLGVHDDEPDDGRAAEYDELDDVVRTTSTAFMGLTVGCARCHDHKFDPIPQADYYRLLSFFHNVKYYQGAKYTRDSAAYTPLGDRAKVEAWWAGQDRKVQGLNDSLAGVLAPAREKLLKAKLPTLPAPLREACAVPAENRTPGQKKLYDEAVRRAVPADAELVKSAETMLDGAARKEAKRLDAEIKSVKAQAPPFDFALSVRERGAAPRPTNILVRGNAATPGAEVQPAFLTVLGSQKPAAVKSSNAQSTGLRRSLAEWIAGKDNPLTARVMANRVWQHHFGKGLAPTPDDFGKTGLPPTHPELLDFLAGQFVDAGWSVKRLHKLIMLSATYRQSSDAGNVRAGQVDPADDLLWRQNLHRLEAEAVRDAVLAVSGQLGNGGGGRGFFPKPSREVIAGGSRPGDGWDVSAPAECLRRSVYAFEKRSMLVPLLETFDFNNTAMPTGARAVTTVAPQALMLLNDDFMHAQAEAFADRIAKEAGPDRRRQIERAYALALGRAPSARELEIARAYADRQAERYKTIQSRMSFRPEVPVSVAGSYLNKLKGEDFLSGPRGWHYARGYWGKPYEGILTLVDPASRGPFALSPDVKFADGTLEGRVSFKDGTEVAALIVRGEHPPGADVHAGYDVVFDPKAQTLSLQRHGRGRDEVRTLASTAMALLPGKWYGVRFTAEGARLRVWIDGGASPALDASDPQPLPAGSPGVRAWGAAVGVEELTVTFAGQQVRVADGLPDPNRPNVQAMRALCLALFNLNEFVYVD